MGAYLGHYGTYTLLQGPQFKRDGDKEIPEPFAEVARFYVESRLLQRDIKVQLEGVSNQLVLGTFIHPVSSLDLRSCSVRCGYRNSVVRQGRE